MSASWPMISSGVMGDPRDLIALQSCHLLDFLRADARSLRDRIGRALPHWNAVPGRSFLPGMHAFGLEDSGDHARAEKAGRAAHWAAEENFLKVHNWWHRALCHIELDDPASALALFDGPVSSGATTLDLVDAAALLRRLDLIGVDVGDRWTAVSAAWEALADGMADMAEALAAERLALRPHSPVNRSFQERARRLSAAA
ncbi:MAG: hypothetical protein JJT81_16570 [Rubellimicrobium sp.]|nr:hypothetical protein [Rubellimicrobium sp.]